MNIKDIAKLCDVSASTVSKVLHDDRTISEETRKKVLDVVKEYHYVPYSGVIKNAAPRMNMIAVVLDEGQAFHKELLYAIENKAFDYGYNIVVCNAAEEERRAKYLRILENKGINGMIFLGQGGRGGYLLPTVEVGVRSSAAREEKLSVIQYSAEQMGYVGIRYLLDQGHRKIACFLKQGEEEIKAGYRKAYEEIFTQPKEEWIFELEESLTEEMVGGCVESGVTAIFCSDIRFCNYLYAGLVKCGLSIPGEVSVVCMGNGGLAEQLIPPVTTVEVSVSRIACKVMDALNGMVEFQEPGWTYNAAAEPEIIERGSAENRSEDGRTEKIIVIGNMNMDCNVIVDNTRTRGGTLRVKRTMQFPGGDGANQAAGIGKLGGAAYMLGCLGNDQEGRMIYNSLTEAGVRMNGVVFCPFQTTGKAYITVGTGGQNTIIIEEGANQCLDSGHIKKYESVFDGAGFCIINMELSEETVFTAMDMCLKKKVKMIVKPSAIEALEEEFFGKIDYFVPNEDEAARLVPGDMTIEERAEILFSKGIKNIIITLGEKGCYLKNKDYARFFESQKFSVVDVTGAGDAFISAMAVCLSRKYDIVRSIRLATYAADVSVTRFGVQQAMINQEGLDAYQAYLEHGVAEKHGKE